jgi:8-oxo-dGTP diphosphatase
LAGCIGGICENILQKDECKLDDILDAICLAVTANLDAQGRTEIIPEKPSTDDKGLKMQMVIPKG